MSKYEKCVKVLPPSPLLTKTGVKSQRAQNGEGKFTRAIFSFHTKFDTDNRSAQNRGRGSLRFEIAGANLKLKK
jgi:hypothetical protein